MVANACKRLRRFFIEEDGPTAVEYCVMLMLIFFAVIATVQVLGGSLSSNVLNSADRIDNVIER